MQEERITSLSAIKHSKGRCSVIRNFRGTKLLTLSWQPEKGWRFFAGKRPRGHGQKHTRITGARAEQLLVAAIQKAQAVLGI